MYNPNLKFYFIGIGGSGMSGLAEILLSQGFKVSGSDTKDTEIIEMLKARGSDVFIGHDEKNLPQDTSLVVRSAAISLNNPEVKEAHRRKLPVITRAELLAELMRLKYGVGVAGSHGKTTTTSLIGTILEDAGLDPTVVVGGRVKALGGSGKHGGGDFLVAETDESDRSFLLLSPTIAVITNIDREHMNAYVSFEDLTESFLRFASSIPFYGLAVLCIDCPHVLKITESVRDKPSRVITYGLHPNADLTAKNIVIGKGKSSFTVVHKGSVLGEITVPVPGDHIVLNSLASIAVAFELGVSFDSLKVSLSSFSGVSRRLEVVGVHEKVLVMSDYAHHPTEIKATLSAIKKGYADSGQKIISIFQPHRYSRMKDVFDDLQDIFALSDKVFVTDIYAAGESEIPGITSTAIAECFHHPNAHPSGSLSDTVNLVLSEKLTEPTIIICLGAGSIGALPRMILKNLSEATVSPEPISISSS